MKESGQLQRVYKKWKANCKFQEHCSTSSEDVTPLAMRDVFVAFVMLLVAIGISLALVKVERFFSSMDEKNLRQNDKMLTSNQVPIANC